MLRLGCDLFGHKLHSENVRRKVGVTPGIGRNLAFSISVAWKGHDGDLVNWLSARWNLTMLATFSRLWFRSSPQSPLQIGVIPPSVIDERKVVTSRSFPKSSKKQRGLYRSNYYFKP
jgi:hypothetical protein